MTVDPQHRLHDELLIARVAAGDAGAGDVGRADAHLAACADCRALYADLLAIRAATSAADLRAPRRPRSFRIPADELERLARPAWQRWLGGFGAPRFDVVPPLATVVAGLGLAVMVVGSVGTASVSIFGGPASAPGASELSGRDQAGGLTPAPTGAPSQSVVPAAGGTPATDYKGVSPSASPNGAEGGASQSAAPPPPGPNGTPAPIAVPTSTPVPATGPTGYENPGPPGPPPLAALGALLLAGGAGALVLNLVARRFAAR